MPLRHARAHLHVYKLIHGQHRDHLGWHPDLGWTQLRRALLFTYDEAKAFELASGYGSRLGLPEEGRWYAIGTVIPLDNYPDE